MCKLNFCTKSRSGAVAADNTLEPTEAGGWAKMYHLFVYRREAYMQHYHKRSNIETAYSMIEGKFGSALRSKSDTGQINEALCKILARNICVLIQGMHALNIHPIFGSEIRPEPKMATKAILVQSHLYNKERL